MRNLVSGTRTNALSTLTNAEGNKDLYLDGISITDRVTQGRIGGFIAARDDIQTNVLTPFRRLIASITQQVNIQHRAGVGLDGSTGNDFFNPLQQLGTTTSSAGATISATVTSAAALTLEEYRITFNAAGDHYYVTNKKSGAAVADAAYTSGDAIALSGMSVTITGAVTSSDSFTVSPLTNAISGFGVALTDTDALAASADPRVADPLAAVTANLPGDNANAVLIAQLASRTQTALGTTFSNYYSGLVSTTGAMKQISANTLAFDDNLLTAMRIQRDSVSGVSLDEEAANLIRYQRSYEAGARMIRITDELMQTILSL
jgi:flagellar hook-associated protein 1 FlgK